MLVCAVMTKLPTLTAIGLGIVLFATTNVDDLLVLTGFFADPKLRPRMVILGQFAGVGTLTAASAIAALFALRIPGEWLSLLGIAPLVLGLRGLASLWRVRKSRPSELPENADEQLAKAHARSMSHSQWAAVMLTTIANGGDNLGVYIPMFTQASNWIPAYMAIFAFMTALWCFVSHHLVHHRTLGARIRQCGHIILPFVLLGLGIKILWGVRVLF